MYIWNDTAAPNQQIVVHKNEIYGVRYAYLNDNELPVSFDRCSYIELHEHVRMHLHACACLHVCLILSIEWFVVVFFSSFYVHLSCLHFVHFDCRK